MSCETSEGWEQIPKDEDKPDEVNPDDDAQKELILTTMTKLMESTADTFGEEDDEEGVEQQKDAESFDDSEKEKEEKKKQKQTLFSNNTAVWGIVSLPVLIVVIAMFAEVFRFVMRLQGPQSLQKMDAPNLHCPIPEMYAPMDDNPFYINASR